MTPGQNLYEFLAEAPIPCHEIGLSGQIVFVNFAECELLGLPPDRVLGHPVWEFVAPEARPASRDAVYRKLAGTQNLVPFERGYIRPNGERVIVEIHEKLLHENGRIVGIRSFLIDITQRKRTELARQESEKLYRHLVEHASDIIYRADCRGRFEVFNAMAPKLLGYTAEELTGRSYLDLIRPDFRARVRRFYRQQLTRRLTHTYLEFPALSKDGKELWFGQNVQIIEEDGRVVGFQAITRDITRALQSLEMLQSVRDELEQRVKERTAELECANHLLRLEIEQRQREEAERRQLQMRIQHTQRLESIGVLAGGIAHDFNNILTAIIGFASLALPHIPETAGARANIEEVISAARIAAQLTQQMLAYSGRGKFSSGAVNLSELTQEVARLIGRVISRNASLELNLARDLPSIEGDSAQLKQLLVNLMTNASDALADHPGTIRLTTGTEFVDQGSMPSVFADRQLPGGEYVFVQVEDTGCGMDESTITKIFDPFFTTKFFGRGLGLAAVHGIVRGHNGTLEVQSEPGRGTIFRVLFPAIAERGATARHVEEAGLDDWRFEGAVLVVDDEPAVRSVAGEILQRVGAKVFSAADGYEALRLFQQHAAEIRTVLVDLTMPGIDGGEVFQRIRQMDPEVKVILCSGYSEEEAHTKCGPIPPTGFLRKPFSVSELIQTLRGTE